MDFFATHKFPNRCNYIFPIQAEAAIWCFLIAAAGILPVMCFNSGYFALSNDFIAQEIPFGMLMNDAIKSGSLWSWAIDLGGNYLESFAFYDIGSPFFLLTLLFPAKLYPKLIGWVFLLKFACSGATSALWMKRHLSRREAILIGAVLYSFSGAQCINTVFYHFQDVMALFPLMMTGLEELVEENKHGHFSLACAVNMLCNPIFFFASAIFLIIYFVCSYATTLHNFRTICKFSLLCLLEGIVGSMAGAIVAIPMALSVLGNSRATAVLPIADWFTMPFREYLIRFMAFFLPAESMNAYSALYNSDWESWGAYIPLFGMIFVMVYVSGHRDRFTRMIICCLIIAFIPILNSSFVAFSEEQYGRWLFMADIIFACVTAKICEDMEQYRSRLYICSLITICLLPLFTLSVCAGIARIGLFWIHIAVAVGCAIFFLQYTRKKRKCSLRKLTVYTLIVSAGLFCFSIGGYTFQTEDNTDIDFRNFSDGCAESAVTYVTETPSMLSQDIGPYRYYFDEGIHYTYYNLSMTNSLPSINSFISTCNNSITEFYGYLGKTRTIVTPAVTGDVNDLLGARYVLSSTMNPELGKSQMLTNANGQVFYLQENLNAIPIGGLIYDCYITESEFLTLDSDLAGAVMLRCMVVKDDDASDLPDALAHITLSDTLAEGPIKRADITNFQIGKDQFDTTLVSDLTGYAFFSVPYEHFWHCTVDNEIVEILNINGLMAVPISEGENHITFTYRYTPFKWALVCSALGIPLCLGLCLSNQLQKRKLDYKNI